MALAEQYNSARCNHEAISRGLLPANIWQLLYSPLGGDKISIGYRTINGLNTMAKEIERATSDGLSVGDVIIDKQGVVSYITNIMDGIVHYKVIQPDDDGRSGRLQIEKIGRGYYRRVCSAPTNKTYWELYQELEQKAVQALLNPSQLTPDELPDHTTALVTSSGPERMLNAKADLEDKILSTEVIKRMIEARVSAISSIMYDMEKQVKKLSRVIGVFELYLGIGEEIVQIQEGQPASPDTPISIRQSVLFADEEVGDPTDGGINWEDVDRLDDWLTTDQNYTKAIPETKGIVAMRPSRQARWHQGLFGEFFAVGENDYRCYLLIRNGENLYRIYTSIPRIGEHFFPNRDEFRRIAEMMDSSDWDREKAEIQHLDFARNAMLIQGLIDRTDILKPIDYRPDVMASDNDPLIQYIYDGELTLPAGRLSYREWKAEINSQIKRGTRVVIGANISRHFDYKGDPGRFLRYYSNGTPPIA